MSLKNLFSETSLEGIQEGSPAWFAQQKKLLQEKPLLKRNYDLWYECMALDAKSVKKKGYLVELGSGGSYLQKKLPELITSDVVDGVAERVIDARKLPFKNNTVQALFLTHVFHHIPDVEAFLKEAQRVLVPGGVISMIETTNTPLGRLFYTHFHPEPHNPLAKKWTFSWNHNLHDSNQALSWIVFERDKKKFSKLFSSLEIERKNYLPWLSYVMSGGVTRKELFPRIFTKLFLFIDKMIQPFNPLCSLSWHIVIRKKTTSKKPTRKK